MEWGVWLGLALAGVLAGVVSGLMGVGGGIVMTPVLHYLVGRPWHEAVALSLFVIAVQSPVGIWRHQRRGAVSLRIAVPLIAGGAAGVVAGMWLEPRIAVPGLKVAFAGLMLLAAYRLTRHRLPAAEGHRPHAAALIGLGVGAGVVSRLLGVGGGILTVPALALMGVSAHVAVGTSLVPVFTNAAVATGANLATGLAWLQAVPLAVGAVAGAPAGVWAAHALPDAALRRVVSTGLVLVAVLIAAEAAGVL